MSSTASTAQRPPGRLKRHFSCAKPGKEIFIIGGGSVYRQFMPLADRLMVTHIHKEFTADTFFPEIDADEWYVSEKEDHIATEDDGAQLYLYNLPATKVTFFSCAPLNLWSVSAVYVI